MSGTLGIETQPAPFTATGGRFVVQPRCGWNGVVGAPTQGALRDPGLRCATALRLARGDSRWGRTMWPWLRNAEGV